MIEKSIAYKIFKWTWVIFLFVNIVHFNSPEEIDIIPFIHVSRIPFLGYIAVILFGLAIIPVKMFLKIFNERKNFIPLLLIFLLLCTAVISSAFSEFPYIAYGVCNRIFFYYLILIIAIGAVKYFPSAGNFIIKSFIYANILVILGSLLDFYVPQFHRLLVERFDRPEMIHSYMKIGEEKVMRPMGFLTDSNLTAFSIGFALLLLLVNYNRFNKIFRYGFYISGSYIFGMLASRGSLLMCIILLIIFFVFRLVNRREILTFIMLFILFQLITPQTYGRIISSFDKARVEEEMSVGRPVIWEAAVNVFGQNPVIGAGPGVFFKVSQEEIRKILQHTPGINLDRPDDAGYHKIDSLNPHSIFLVMLTETGITGFALFLTLIIFLALLYLREKKILSFLFLSGILLVSGLSNFAPYYKFYLSICIIFYIAAEMNMKLTFSGKHDV